MLCDKCKKNVATFHRSVSINGKGYETHLCAECAAHMESDPFVNALTDMFDDSLEWNEKNREFVSVFDTFNKPRQVKELDKAKDYKLDESVLSIEQQIEALQNQIKLAVESENYEEAAKLKKEIDKLKGNN